MGNSWFQFQQFRVEQDRCAMKISTDAVLLGSLAQSNSPKQILDIGTGTGVIALMLAQRFVEAQIIALELDPEAAAQAAKNCQASPFSQRIQVKEGRLQTYTEENRFDLIVSNPPYFPDHLKSNDAKRNQAIHTDSLSFAELLQKARLLLTDNGSLWIILPPRQMRDFSALAAQQNLHPVAQFLIRDTPAKPIHREVICFTPSAALPSIPPRDLCLKLEDGTYSEEYRTLLAGFLLGF
jgi:tRNA1Val (adenine37-N6)-methyltransferase